MATHGNSKSHVWIPNKPFVKVISLAVILLWSDSVLLLFSLYLYFPRDWLIRIISKWQNLDTVFYFLFIGTLTKILTIDYFTCSTNGVIDLLFCPCELSPLSFSLLSQISLSCQQSTLSDLSFSIYLSTLSSNHNHH